MEYFFCKEQQHNYLVIHCENSSQNLIYQRKMLELKTLNNIVPVNVRDIDGEIFNYYNITSHISMRQFFGTRKLTMNDFRELINGMRMACIEADKYMLETGRIRISPDFIFYDFINSKYSFIYDTSKEDDNNLNSEVSEFLDYLLDAVSSDDVSATDYVYKLYEFGEKREIDIWDMCSLFPNDTGEELTLNECIYSDSNEVYTEDRMGKGSYKTAIDKEKNMELATAYNDADYVYGCKQMNAYKPKYSFLCIGALGIIICVIVFILMELNENEMVIMYAGGAFSMLIFIAGLLLPFAKRVKNRNIDEKVEDLDTLIKDTNLCQEVKMQDFVATSKKTFERKNINDDLEAESGQTVFFSEEMVEGRYKLFSTDKKNKTHIELDKIPGTIGKLANYADYVIDDESISRIHARISRNDDGLFIEDLNSTNGIFINGIRLRPNETMYIEPGDEIRLGRKNYCLRNVM